MRPTRRPILALTGLAIGAILFTACGSSSTTNSTSGSGSGAAPTVRAEQVPTVGTVLVDSKGLTLYFLKGETAASVKCTGSCVTTWPPLTIASGAQPTAGPNVPGKLGTRQLPDGSLQVTYDGLPLYTFTGDSGAGQASGQGVENFFVVSPRGSTNNSGSSSSGGYYGSGY